LVENRQFEPNPTSIWRPVGGGGDPFEVSPRFLASKKLDFIVRRSLCDPVFSHFDTVPASGSQTDRHTTTAYTALA